MHAVYADEAATVKMGDLKAEDRYTAKVNEYQKAGKSSPKGSHIKDIMRCLLQVAGHAEMKRAHEVLQEKYNVRSTKDRVDSITHDLLCVIVLDDDVIAEVQIGFTSVVAMKLLGHVGYQYLRVDTKNLGFGSGVGPLFVHN